MSVCRLRLRPNRPLDQDCIDKRDLSRGIVSLVVVAALGFASAMVFVAPPGQLTYRAEMPESGSLRVGDDVRIAGVPVGKVSSVSLTDDAVDLSFTVDKKFAIGDQTSLSVRMLTIVGGYYVALTPAGDNLLADNIIPAERVAIPYSLARVFQDAVRPVMDTNGDTLLKNVTALDEAITDSPDGFRQMTGAVSSLVDILDRQNRDVSRTLGLVDEYVASLDSAKGQYKQLIDRLNTLETVFADKRSEMREGLALLRRVLARVSALVPVWDAHFASAAGEATKSIPELDELIDKMTTAGSALDELLTRIQGMVNPEGMLSIDQSDVKATVSAPCVPVPWRQC